MSATLGQKVEGFALDATVFMDSTIVKTFSGVRVRLLDVRFPVEVIGVGVEQTVFIAIVQ